jgi:tRNA (adenine37-N6)-methyltransferase
MRFTRAAPARPTSSWTWPISRRSAPLTGASRGSTLCDPRLEVVDPFAGALAVRAVEARFAGCFSVPAPLARGRAALRAALPPAIGLLPAFLPPGRAAGFRAGGVCLVAALERCAFFAMRASLSETAECSDRISDPRHYHGTCYDPRFYLQSTGRGHRLEAWRLVVRFDSVGHMSDAMLTVEPVAYVRSPRTSITDDDWGDVVASIELVAAFPGEALDGLEGFSHVEVIFHFNHVASSAVVTGARHPRGNQSWPKVGIFSQRGRDRPNRIGTTIVEVVERNDRTLRVRGLDAVDGTPVIDLKPVMAEFLPRSAVRQPAWSIELMRDYWSLHPSSRTAAAAVGAMKIDKVNLAEKLALFSDHWHPRIIGELNGQQVKVVKFKGEFVWHAHAAEDELFLVVSGELRMEFRDRTVDLREGEFLIVPRGVEHRPVAEREVQVVLFEPASTINTGAAGGDRTVHVLDRL